MNQYIITEEQLETILQRRGAIYISCQGKFRDDIVKDVRSRPYNPQAEREKVLVEVIKKIELMIDAERERGWDGAYTTEGRIKLNVLAYVSNSIKKLREGKEKENSIIQQSSEEWRSTVEEPPDYKDCPCWISPCDPDEVRGNCQGGGDCKLWHHIPYEKCDRFQKGCADCLDEPLCKFRIVELREGE